MKIRRSIMAAAAAVVLSGTGALVVPAVASAHSATTTLKFTAVQKHEISWLPINSTAVQETDVNAKVRPSGSTSCIITAQTCCSVTGNMTFTLRGGLLYGSYATNGSPTFSGTVTGETGTFQGATGTINGTTNAAGTRTQYTITYS